MEDLVKVLLDEFKDAKMLYDYACAAKKMKKDDFAIFYIQRAEQRLKMMDEDHALLVKWATQLEKEGKYAKEGKWDYLHTFYQEEKKDLVAKIKSFK